MPDSRFSLSHVREKVLPETVTGTDGAEIPVDADYRTVLRCLRVLTDPDIPDRDKLYLLMRWFFRGVRAPDGVTLFLDFSRSDVGEDGDEEPKMDFEFDADAIYSSFLQAYGMDLLDVPFLHWRRFLALLNGLGEHTAIGRRIALRGMDTAKMSPKDRAKVEKAKAAIRIEKKISAEESALQAELDRRLAAGEDVTDVVARLREWHSHDAP